MGLVLCQTHGPTPLQPACPHIGEAARFNARCVGIEYRQYRAADDPELVIGCWFCPFCIAEYSLPGDGTAIADPDVFLDVTGKAYSGVCCKCFDDWKRRGMDQPA